MAEGIVTTGVIMAPADKFHDRDACWYMVERDNYGARLDALSKEVSDLRIRVEVNSVRLALYASIGSMIGAALITLAFRYLFPGGS